MDKKRKQALAASLRAAIEDLNREEEELTKRARWFVILFFLPLLAGQSQPPAPTPPKTRQDKQQGASGKDNETGGDKSPSVSVSVVNAPVTTDSTQHEYDSPPTDWWVRILTVVIASATVAQAYIYWRQKELMSAALKDTTRAVSAAKQSADTANATFVSAQRPRLTIRFVSPAQSGILEPESGRFLLFNTGDTKAILKSHYSKVLLLEAGLETGIPYESLTDRPFEIVELAPGQSAVVHFRANAPERPPGEIRDYDLHKSGNFYIVGWIDYADVTGRIHKKGFAYHYNRTTERFDRLQDEEYEYDD